MQPILLQQFGNASSLHSAGQAARFALEESRRNILSLLGDPAGELVFTSGGTESDNLALFGAADIRKPQGQGIVVSAIEHSAVFRTAESLSALGFDVAYAPVDNHGMIDLAALEKLITPQTTLVSVMHANNETGVVQPIRQIAQLAHARGAWLHTDAVQSFGKIPVNVIDLGVDLLSISAHKFYGPKGAGALYLRRGIKVTPRQVGGPHESGMRAGTHAVADMVGMSKAATLSIGRMGGWARIAPLRDRLVREIQKQIPDVFLNGHPDLRVANTANLSFLGCQGEDLLMALDLEGICVSTGAACSSGSTRPSRILGAMGLSDERISGSIRFSLGLKNTDDDVTYLLERLPPIIKRMRAC